MNELFGVLAVEAGKLRRSRALQMSLVAAYLVVLLPLVVTWSRGAAMLRPGLGFEAAVPIGELAWRGLRIDLGSGWLVALLGWVALRWTSFAPALGTGILITVAAVALTALGPEAWPWFPGSLPYRAAGLSATTAPLASCLLGLLGGLTTGALATHELARRDVV